MIKAKMIPQTCRTLLRYQTDSTLHTLPTTVLKTQPFTSLPEPSQSVFKSVASATAAENPHVVITASTIFHPQGGGQPSDTGTIRLAGSSSTATTTFHVAAVRHDAGGPSAPVLHLGHFTPADATFTDDAEVIQDLDVTQRALYSRLHTAGHVLGVAVRDTCKHHVPGFSELKASHFPDAASCEFRGNIDGAFKEAIQARVDELVAEALKVEVEWWEPADFEREGVEAPDPALVVDGERFRVVRIVGAECYPCGGTHVADTGMCGKVVVKKISRSKGVSRVSYALG